MPAEEAKGGGGESEIFSEEKIRRLKEKKERMKRGDPEDFIAFDPKKTKDSNVIDMKEVAYTEEVCVYVWVFVCVVFLIRAWM
jgi:hypothetical protein